MTAQQLQDRIECVLAGAGRPYRVKVRNALYGFQVMVDGELPEELLPKITAATGFTVTKLVRSPYGTMVQMALCAD